LLSEIKKDVERLYPDGCGTVFQTPAMQTLVTDVLFVWCRGHQRLSYCQGMHELLAVIVWTLLQEDGSPGTAPPPPDADGDAAASPPSPTSPPASPTAAGGAVADSVPEVTGVGADAAATPSVSGAAGSGGAAATDGDGGKAGPSGGSGSGGGLATPGRGGQGGLGAAEVRHLRSLVSPAFLEADCYILFGALMDTGVGDLFDANEASEDGSAAAAGMTFEQQVGGVVRVLRGGGAG
jgi:hypothetical protein